MSNEKAFDPADLANIADAISEAEYTNLPLGAPEQVIISRHQDEMDENEAKHEIERERIIGDKISVNDPAFEQKAHYRRAAIHAHNKLLPTVGTVPDDFVEPPAAHDPAPRPATGFVVQSAKRRRTKSP